MVRGLTHTHLTHRPPSYFGDLTLPTHKDWSWEDSRGLFYSRDPTPGSSSTPLYDSGHTLGHLRSRVAPAVVGRVPTPGLSLYPSSRPRLYSSTPYPTYHVGSFLNSSRPSGSWVVTSDAVSPSGLSALPYVETGSGKRRSCSSLPRSVGGTPEGPVRGVLDRTPLGPWGDRENDGVPPVCYRL